MTCLVVSASYLTITTRPRCISKDNTIYFHLYTEEHFGRIQKPIHLLIYIKIYKLARLGKATPSVAALSENQDTLPPAWTLTNPLGKL